MSDRELLELAAKAAGLETHWGSGWQSEMMFREIPRPNSPLAANVEWNPIDDAGDAFNLVVTLRLHTEPLATMGGKPFGWRAWPAGRGDCDASVSGVGAESLRLAIVGAAAEIGRGMGGSKAMPPNVAGNRLP